ncbi:hypothetical protein [Aminipila sp.]|uniref:hypothetical protein n=1 Tax=Aminipila sp. TaxID=2060095 RepID=UPI0028985466|nr:hypothetical protein [Aminipila sp.]
MKKFLTLLLTLVLVLSLASCGNTSTTEPTNNSITYLSLDGWDETVKGGINDLFDMYGKNSEGYDPDLKPYAVFDFDNTISILDIEEALAIYQLEHLRFAMEPQEMEEVLLTGIPKDKVQVSLGEDYRSSSNKDLTIATVAKDAAAAYKKLYDAGYVAADNSLESKKEEWLKTDDWKEFSSKMRWMYSAIGDTMDVSVSYPWITYWFTGMTPEQVYALATESHQFNLSEAEAGKWETREFAGPVNYDSLAGPLSISYKYPVGISEEMKELISALDDNGFDVWICSASFIDVIKAAAMQPEQFGLQGIDGVVAMESKLADGVYDNVYNYDAHPQTQGLGKSETIEKVIMPKYNGRGPVLTAMDSQGDFNFCSEFKDTAVNLILNRQRSDDAGLLSVAAVYQKEKGIDLASAQASGDTLFLLQGRDENKGILLPQAECINLGKTDALLFSDKAQSWYEMLQSGQYKTIGDMINDCVSITGKLAQYDGYKTK